MVEHLGETGLMSAPAGFQDIALKIFKPCFSDFLSQHCSFQNRNILKTQSHLSNQNKFHQKAK